MCKHVWMKLLKVKTYRATFFKAYGRFGFQPKTLQVSAISNMPKKAILYNAISLYAKREIA